MSETSGEMKSLSEFLAIQESVASWHADAARSEFDLIERGLILGWSVTLYLNDGPILDERKAKAPEASMPETIRANLLHAAWGSLVNATRLALYGAHVDSLNLARAAFEAAYHADYFRDHPEDAAEWDRCGSVKDLMGRRKCIDEFQRTKRVRRVVGQKYKPEDSMERFFAELSTYGTHANPVTVALRLSSPVDGVASLGFTSVGRPEATKLCASHILHTLAYVLSEYHDGFADYLAQNETLTATYQEFEAELAAVRSRSPRELSLFR